MAESSTRNVTGSRTDRNRQSRPARQSWICLIAVVAGTVCSVVLRWMVPIRPIGLTVPSFDDGLFERSAVALANNNWLGPLDRVTLSKGPSYPAFIALIHKLGIPLQVGEQLTYLAGAGCLALGFYLLTRRMVATIVIYLVLAFDPANFTSPARVIRDGWYGGLSLLLVGSLFLTAYCVRRRVRLIWTVPAAVLTGLTASAFWLCREEGVWIIPSALVIMAVPPLAHFVQRRRAADRPGTDGSSATRLRPSPDGRYGVLRLGQVVLVCVIGGITFYAPIAYVGATNERLYGLNGTTDFADGAFPKAYAAWTRVRGVELRQYVPISRGQREAVYAVSPAARELQPVLEDPHNLWIKEGCLEREICDDFTGGWMPWAVRDAAAKTGHFGSEPGFQAFFNQLAEEINAACTTGQLECAPHFPTTVQPVLRASVLPTVGSAGVWLVRLLLDPSYYNFRSVEPMFSEISEADRATLQQAIVGVPSTDAEAAEQLKTYESRQWIYDGLGTVFRGLFVVLVLMSVLGVILGIGWRSEHRRNFGLWVLTASLGVGIVVRLILLAVIDTTQFAVDPRYHYATRTFLLALAAIGALNLAHILWVHDQQARRPLLQPDQ